MANDHHPDRVITIDHGWIIEALIHMATYAEKYGLNSLHDQLAEVVCSAASGELAAEARIVIDNKYMTASGRTNVVPFRRHLWDV